MANTLLLGVTTGLVVVMVFTERQRRFTVTALSMWWVVFVAFTLIPMFRSFVFLGAQIDLILREYRGIIYYLSVIPLAAVIRDRDDIADLVMIILLGVAAGLLTYFLARHGAEFPNIPPPSHRSVSLNFLSRAVVDENVMIAAFFLSASITLVTPNRGFRIFFGLLTGFYVLGILYSGTQTAWISILVVLPLYLYLSSENPLQRWWQYLFVVGVLLGGTFIGFILWHPFLRECVVGVCVNTGSITVVESLGLRIKEYYYITTDFIFPGPVFGTGFGRRYGLAPMPGTLASHFNSSSMVFWLLGKTGIVGLSLYGFLWIMFFKTYVKVFIQSTDWLTYGIVLGVGTGAISLLIYSTLHSALHIQRAVIYSIYFTIIGVLYRPKIDRTEKAS